MDRYEIFSGMAGRNDGKEPVKQWYWRLVAKNNQIVATSEGYNRRGQAIKSVDRVRSIAQTTAVVENLGRGGE